MAVHQQVTSMLTVLKQRLYSLKFITNSLINILAVQ